MSVSHLSIRAPVNPGRRLLLLAVAALAGCTTPPVLQSPQAAHRRLVTAFTLEGRLAASDGVRNANGSVVWTHGATRDEWSAVSPLGQIVARITADASGAVLDTHDGQRHAAPDIDSLLPEIVGVQLPVAALTHWVQAVPRSGARVLQLDDAGRPARISDAGWIIDYTRYADDTPGAMPVRMDAHWGETRIRLLIDAWTPAP